MYITITPQKLGANYSQSSAGFVDYLEKENQLPDIENDHEFFFNQKEDDISPEVVIKEIDANTSKLKKIEPKFYSITVNPSQYELKKLQNSSDALKQYTRELMKDYASCFNREINGRPVTLNDIKYFAKIEHQRAIKGTDFHDQGETKNIGTIQGRTSSTELCHHTFCNRHNNQKRIKFLGSLSSYR